MACTARIFIASRAAPCAQFAGLAAQIFFATVGANASISAVISSCPALFVFCFIQISIHLGLTLGVGSALGFSRRELLLSSNANVGGEPYLPSCGLDELWHLRLWHAPLEWPWARDSGCLSCAGSQLNAEPSCRKLSDPKVMRLSAQRLVLCRTHNRSWHGHSQGLADQHGPMHTHWYIWLCHCHLHLLRTGRGRAATYVSPRPSVAGGSSGGIIWHLLHMTAGASFAEGG